MKKLLLLFCLTISACNMENGQSINPDTRNQAPTIAPIPTVKAVIGKITSVTISASDQDGDRLAYSLVGQPNWASIRDNVIILSPQRPHAGEHKFKVRVSDGSLSSETETSVVVSLPSSTDIDITSIGTINVKAGIAQTYQAKATISSGVPLYYHVVPSPSWLTINASTGIITINAPIEALGISQFDLIVSDGSSTKTLSFFVNVTLQKAQLNYQFFNKEPRQLVYYDLTINDTIKVSSNTSETDQNLPSHINFYAGDKIKIEVKRTSNNQTCYVEKNIFKISQINESVRFNCLTKTSQSFKDKYKRIYIQEGSAYVSPYTLSNDIKQPIGGHEGATVEFTSTDSRVADVDFVGERKILQVIPKEVGKTSIVASPSPEFYDNNNEAEYTLEVLDKTKTARVEFCQINCVDVNSKYQALVGGRDVLIRTYNLDGNYDISIKDNMGNIVFEKAINCNTKISTPPTYDKQDSCNIKISGIYINPDFEYTMTKAGATIFNSTPNIYKNSHLIVTLVPFKINLPDGSSVVGTYNPTPGTQTSEQALKYVKDILFDKFPFTSIDVRLHPNMIEMNASSILDVSIGKAYDKLEILRNNELGPPYESNHIYYGLVPSNPNKTLGAATIGEAVGIDASQGGGISNSPFCPKDYNICLPIFLSTMIHEIGHALKLAHAPCKVNVAVSGSWDFVYWMQGRLSHSPIYSYKHEDISSPLGGESKSPFADVMGYCSGTQFSELNIFNILNHVSKIDAFSSKAKAKAKAKDSKNSIINISWFINDDNEVIFRSIKTGVKQHGEASSLLVNIKTKEKQHFIMASKFTISDINKAIYNIEIPSNETIEEISILNSDGIPYQANESLPHELNYTSENNY